MKRIMIAVVLGNALPTLASDGNSDDYCLFSSTGFSPIRVVRVDDDLSGQMNFRSDDFISFSLTDPSEIENAVDEAIQNMVRQSRARLEVRTADGTFDCHANDSDQTSCIVGATNAQSNACADPNNADVIAYSFCGDDGYGNKGCNLVYCLDHLPQDFFDWGGNPGNANWLEVTQHERGGSDPELVDRAA